MKESVSGFPSGSFRLLQAPSGSFSTCIRVSSAM